jgi:hypothetical protein
MQSEGNSRVSLTHLIKKYIVPINYGIAQHSCIPEIPHRRALKIGRSENEKFTWFGKRKVLNAPALEITTNIGCPVACVYCPQPVLLAAYKKRSSVYTMSFECFKTCVDKVPAEVAIDFSGMSEGWKNPECTRMVQYASERGHRVRIHTTLSGMRKEDVTMLSTLPLEAFRVHLPSNNYFEKITVDARYLEVLENVASLIPAARFVCFGKRTNLDAVKLLRKYPTAEIRMASASNRADNRCSEKPLFCMRKGAMTCANNARYNILLPNGDVILCCMDYGLKNVLGNLLSMNYAELFQGQVFQKICVGFKDPSLETLCRSCTVFGYHTNIMADIYYRIPHWLSSYPVLRSWPQFAHSVKRNLLRYARFPKEFR